MDAAILGLAEEAQSMVIDRCKHSPASGWRFQGFPGPFQVFQNESSQVLGLHSK